MISPNYILPLLIKLYLKTISIEQYCQFQKDKCIDWEVHLDQLKGHKLTAIFQYTSIINKKAFKPIRWKKSFLELFKKHKKKLESCQEMFHIQQTFLSKDILILPYKGLVFGQQFYGDIRQRDTGDIDFAIDKKDIPKTKTLMEALGYVEKKGQSDYQNLTNSRSYYIDYSWVKYDEYGHIKHWIEFHWQPANSALYCPYEFKDLEKNNASLIVSGKKILVFNKLSHILITIIHHGIVDNWGELRHLVDLVKILETLDKQEASALVEATKKNRIYYIFCLGLTLTSVLLEYEHRDLTAHLLKKSKVQSLIKAIENQSIVGDWSQNPIKLYYYLRSRDSITDSLKSIYAFSRFAMKEIKFKMKTK